MARIIGNALRNRLAGTSGADVISGLGGSDTLLGRVGNDVLLGGTGIDFLFGEDGNDRLFGGTGNDKLNGGNGNDLLDGGTGNDILAGGRGVDTFRGGAGVDTADFSATPSNMDVIFTDNGNARSVYFAESGNGTVEEVLTGIENVIGSPFLDRIEGSETSAINNIFTGGAGDDSLSGGAGSDMLLGGIGTDYLDGGTGKDTLDGGTGDDSLTGGAGADRLIGGIGSDSVGYTLSGSITVDLSNPSNNIGAEAVGDTYSSIENIYRGSGSRDDDTLSGNAANNILYGGGGSDTLTGRAGADTFMFSSETQTPALTSDFITDFEQGADIIDIGRVAGPQFVFLNGGNAPFTLAAPEITFGFAVESGQDRTIILADIDGDTAAEFVIRLTGFVLLTAADFML